MLFSKQPSRNGIIALNGILLVVLAAIVLSPKTEAQSTSQHRYLALPSVANGISTGIVYIMDTTQRELVAVAWDHNRNRIVTFGYRNVSADAQSVLNQ